MTDEKILLEQMEPEELDGPLDECESYWDWPERFDPTINYDAEREIRSTNESHRNHLGFLLRRYTLSVLSLIVFAVGAALVACFAH